MLCNLAALGRVVVVIVLASFGAFAQTTVFTYQGKLNDGAVAANGSYDLQFRLFNTPANGTQAGPTVVSEDVQVVNGIFTVNLDFGPGVFPAADERWIDIGVRPGASTGAFTPLSPRQFIASAPYAMRSGNAGFADLAGTANFATDTAAVGGTPAAQIIKEGDVRLTDARTPLPGSPSYVQISPASPQAGNLNIGGNATVGSTISGNVVNAATQFNIGGNRILSVAGSGNVFAGINSGTANAGGNNSFFGVSAGQANTIGNNNSFFGRSAGLANTEGGFNAFFGSGAGDSNTTGGSNAFFGTLAGESNTTGSNNSIFGLSAGQANSSGGFNAFFGVRAGDSTTTGLGNSFFGALAGEANTTGSDNTMIGNSANVASNNLNYATAIGAGSIVSTSDTIVLGRNAGQDTVQVPGNLNVAGTITGNINGAGLTNLNASNIASGMLADARLSTNVATLSGAQTFTGAKTFSGGIAGSGSGLTNLGAANLTGTVAIANGGTGSATQNFVDLTNAQTIDGNKTFSNTLSGNIVNAATQYNIIGSRVISVAGTDNFFAGVGSGNTGSSNSFVGSSSGTSNTTGQGNAFFGARTGFNNLNGDFNTFFGADAGLSNTSSCCNSFVGYRAGRLTTGVGNSFFGYHAGQNNTSGINNLFIGSPAGNNNTTGSNNTFLGTFSNSSAGDLTNATAIGYNAVVSQSNSLVLGNGANVGIGTTAPKTKLHIVGGSIYVANPDTMIITSPNGACWGITVNNAGVLATFPVSPCP